MARYKEGDIVKVLPYESIASQFKNGICLPSGCCFPEAMRKWCSHELTVADCIDEGRIGFYKVYGTDWTFTDEMLEDATGEAEDVDSTHFELNFSFNDLMQW